MTVAVNAEAALVGLRILSKSKRIELDWSDGQTTTLTHRMLRVSCRCAACVVRRSQGLAIEAPPQIELTDVDACGAGAVQLTFSDGHSRGIYPFAYLQSLAAQA